MISLGLFLGGLFFMHTCTPSECLLMPSSFCAIKSRLPFFSGGINEHVHKRWETTQVG